MNEYTATQYYDCIAQLKQITLLSENEIKDFLESNAISMNGLRDFYLRFGRFPTKNEQVIVMHGFLDTIPYESNIGELSKVLGSIPIAKKPFPYVQVMFAIFILFVLLHYAGCMQVTNQSGL